MLAAVRVSAPELPPKQSAKQPAGQERVEPAREETIDVSQAWDERAAVRTAAT